MVFLWTDKIAASFFVFLIKYDFSLMTSFSSKNVWITGASSGIGEALAYAFSKKGAMLILSARNVKELERVKNNCSFPKKVHIFPLDISNHSQVFDVGKKIMNQFKTIDVLINNAGVSQRSLAAETSFDVDESLIATNFLGTVAVTKSILPGMIAKEAGQIVVITSIVGKIGTPLRSSYSASKHALHGFFDSLRTEVYDKNIDVLLVCPGFVKTNVSINALNATGAKQGTMDVATEKGLSADYVAEKIIKAIDAKKEEVIIAGFREKTAVLLKRFVPTLFSKIIRKSKVV